MDENQRIGFALADQIGPNHRFTEGCRRGEHTHVMGEKKELSDFNENFRIFGTCQQGGISLLSEAVISRFTLIYVGEYSIKDQKIVLQSYCDLNKLNKITKIHIENIIKYSQRLSSSFSGINMNLLQMCNLLNLANNIYENLNQSENSLTPDKILSIIVYYSIRGILYNRESKLINKLCDIVDLKNRPEEELKKMVSPIYIDEIKGEKVIKSKITNLFIKSHAQFIKEIEKDIAFTHQFNEMVEILHFGLANNVPVIFEVMP